MQLKGQDISEAVLIELEKLMAERGFAVFRDQENLTREEQVRVSALFGGKEIHSTHGVHPQAPNQHIFRLSNDERFGILGVGPQWHNDGSFLEAPFSHVGYYSVKAPASGGETYFASTALPWTQDFGLTAAEKERWSRFASVNSNGGVIHPVVYQHRLTRRTHIYLHLGMTGAVLERVRPLSAVGGGDASLSDFRLLPPDEMKTLFNRYNALLNDHRVHWKHQYRTGDLVIIDNLAVAHKADPTAHEFDTRQGIDGLRILHRTTVKGLAPFHANHVLPGVGRIPMEYGRHPFNPDGVWKPGGLGFRWDDSIHMQN
jgi:taurine dioxygenase